MPAREAEARLRGLLDGSFDGIMGFDLEYRYTVWSRAMERISGVPAERVLGRVAFEVFPFLCETGEDDVFRRVLAGDVVVNRERPYRVPETGREGVFEGSYFPVRDGEGRIAGGMAIIRDVSDRTRLEDVREVLEREIAAREEAEAAGRRAAFLAEAGRLLGSSLDCAATLASLARLAVPRLADGCLVHLVERDGTVREVGGAHVDPAKLELARELDRRRAVPGVLATGRPELVPVVTEAHLAAAMEGEDRDRARWCGPTSYMIVPIVSRERTLGTISFATTTPGHRFGQSDLALAQDLAQHAALAIDNARLYEEAQALDRRKDELLAMLGHELRNPLGAIRTALMVVNHAGTTPEEGARQRTIIDRQMRHVVGLVDDLLDVSRVMSGRITLEPRRVDLNEIARQCLVAVERDERARDHDLSLSVHAGPVEVLGDAMRLEQVVFNLLDNALKYTPAGGQIEMRVARENGNGVIRVRDTGIGLPPEVLPRVFDVFMQADVSLARSRGGLGLGLTLVRKLVELHGGRVAVHSDGPGRGSEFVISVPFAPVPVPEADAAAAPVPPPAPSRRVLVIEDNPDARDALCALLRVWGHRVETAADGPRGFELALETQPDVVIVDIGLPGLDGYHVAHGLRAALGADVFLVALTGYGQPDDRQRALDAGFDVHLMKPVAPEVLAETLARTPLAPPETGYEA